MEQVCEATHDSPTAQGPVTVRCALPAGHEPAEDHEAWVGPFPVRWSDQPSPPTRVS